MTVEAKSEDTQTGESVISVEESTIKASEKNVDVPLVIEQSTIKDSEMKIEESTIKDSEMKIEESTIVSQKMVDEPTVRDAKMKIEASIQEPTIKVDEKNEDSVGKFINKSEESTIKDEEKKIDPVVVAEGNVEEKKMEDELKTKEVVVEEEKMKDEENGDLLVSSTPVIEKSSSYKEETQIEQSDSDLKDNEKKALIEFKSKLEEAILQNKLFKKEREEDQKEKENEKPAEEGDNEEKLKPKEGDEENEKKNPETKEEEERVEEKIMKEEGIEEKAEKSSSAETEEEKTLDVVDKDISIWGVPLLPSKDSESTDEILLKFLRARDFKVNEAFEMLKNTLQWRKDKKIDSILEEDLGSDLNSVAYMDGLDFEGHPICYNMYGFFEDDQLYQKSFGTEEKREQFLRWRVQLMEKGIKKLDFKKGGVSSLLQINDLKNSPGPSRKELRIAMKQAVNLLQDNYPEFVARNIFVNVPFWYYAFNAVLSPFLTQRTRSKFVFARPSKVTETLLRYIPAEQIPIRYGGMKRDNDVEFSDEEVVVTELTVKSSSTETIEIPIPEVGSTVLWELTVLGWEVSYKEEFVPTDEGSYTIIVQKGKKMSYNEEPVRNSFRNNEPGKIVLTIENGSFKKKRVLYRYKTKNCSSSS